ncbi:MAG TPA: hypothetical protein VMZ92_10875 [Planctomycetota bacterium]|nr:hypothetical protein [Planctomycetota bacterium]
MTSEEIIAAKAPRCYVVLFRLFLACYFIFVGVCGVKAWQADKAVFAKQYETLAAPGTQVTWFRSYLNATVNKIKDKPMFGWLLVAAPLLLGLSLLLGLWTRLGSLLGVVFILHLYLIKSPSWDAWDKALTNGTPYELPLVHLVELAALALLFFAGAGRTFGLDSVFWRKRLRRKLEPMGPEQGKAAAKSGPRQQFIPLAKTGPAKIEETVGEFPSVEPPKKPVAPAPRTPASGPPAGGGTGKPGQPPASTPPGL